jgi:hypothetical protein
MMIYTRIVRTLRHSGDNPMKKLSMSFIHANEITPCMSRKYRGTGMFVCGEWLALDNSF